MSALKPGENTGKNGGIYQEVGTKGGKRQNYVTVADNRSMPPTTGHGHKWVPVKRTPDSKKK